MSLTKDIIPKHTSLVAMHTHATHGSIQIHMYLFQADIRVSQSKSPTGQLFPWTTARRVLSIIQRRDLVEPSTHNITQTHEKNAGVVQGAF